jgi:catechol 2,3-dioxygenase-like lactoylglutathione lyase family enzyme
MQVRVARQTARLDDVVAFYRDGLGLPELDRFTDHDGYTGVMLDLPGTATHLEFTANDHLAAPMAHPEDLLVLYVGSRQELARLLSRSGGRPVPSANPYWDGVGVTIADPDGFRIVLVPSSWPQ